MIMRHAGIFVKYECYNCGAIKFLVYTPHKDSEEITCSCCNSYNHGWSKDPSPEGSKGKENE